jgi:hypothetical protein
MSWHCDTYANTDVLALKTLGRPDSSLSQTRKIQGPAALRMLFTHTCNGQLLVKPIVQKVQASACHPSGWRLCLPCGPLEGNITNNHSKPAYV